VPSIRRSVAGDAVVLDAYSDGAASYEFEWVFFDKMETTPADPFAAREAVRVSSNAPNAKLDLSYPSGDVYVRGRAVGRFAVASADGPALRLGRWSNPLTITISDTSALAPNFNWSYTASYAENSDPVASLGFFDGSLKSRQVQARVSSRDIRLVGE